MSAPYDSYNTSSFYPPHLGGNDLNTNLLRGLICFIVLLMAVIGSAATPVIPSTSDREIATDSTEIHFHLSQSSLDLGLDGNGERLDNLIHQLQKVSGQDSTFVISTLRIIGSASPEGSEAIDRQLSEQRAHVLFDYFARHITLPDSITDFEYLGRNWKGLYNLVTSDSDVPSRNEVLALLQPAVTASALSTTESNTLLNRIKTLKDGVPYAYMYRQLFPALRYSYLYVEYEKSIHREIDPPSPEPTVIEIEETLVCDTVTAETAVTPIEIGPVTKKPFYMDLRSNMLFDIAAVPNIGAEFYLGKRFSVLANWMYGWWDSNSRHRYWRIYGGELGARWWFGHKAAEKPLTGHHIGVYCGVLTFDFEWGGTGYMGGQPGGTLWDRCLVNSGIEYGYSLPISKHLNIDFSIGLGYLGGNYIKYFPFDNDYYRKKEYKMRFFGPTKAEISLVWLLGRGNTNIRKGGDR